MNTCSTKYNAIRITTILILPFLMAGALYGQLTVKIGEHVRCQNSPVLVPVEVSDFEDVAAITLQITIDTLKTQFLSVENIHTALSGGSIISNFVPSSSSILIIWQSMLPANIGTGTLFDLKFDYDQGNAELNFGETCEIVLSDFTIVEAQLGNGIIQPALQITRQPQPITVVEGENTQFITEVNFGDVHQYLWQANGGDGWNLLSNNEIFSGVTSPVLSIDSAPLAFNHHYFRCFIAYGDCSIMTDSANLEVTPLTVIDPKQDSKPKNLVLFPNPCRKSVNYTLSTRGQDYTIQLCSIVGNVVRQQPVSTSKGTMLLDKLVPGLYYMHLLHQSMPVETVKIIVR